MDLGNLIEGYVLQIRRDGWGWTCSIERVLSFGALELKVTKFKVWDSRLGRGIDRVMRGMEDVR